MLLWSIIKLTDWLKKYKMRTRIIGEIHDSIEKDTHPGKLPVIVLEKTTPVRSGTGDRTSTNYQPTFKIVGWAARGDLGGGAPSDGGPPATVTLGANTIVTPSVVGAVGGGAADFLVYDNAAGLKVATYVNASSPYTPGTGDVAFISGATTLGTGSEFWGCSGYPACRGTRPIG